MRKKALALSALGLCFVNSANALGVYASLQADFEKVPTQVPKVAPNPNLVLGLQLTKRWALEAGVGRTSKVYQQFSVVSEAVQRKEYVKALTSFEFRSVHSFLFLGNFNLFTVASFDLTNLKYLSELKSLENALDKKTLSLAVPSFDLFGVELGGRYSLTKHFSVYASSKYGLRANPYFYKKSTQRTGYSNKSEGAGVDFAFTNTKFSVGVTYKF